MITRTVFMVNLAALLLLIPSAASVAADKPGVKGAGAGKGIVVGASDFQGVNWADPRDNFVDGWIVPSGIDAKGDTADVAKRSRKILAQFRRLLGANTVRLGINPPTVLDGTWWPKYKMIVAEAVALDMKVILGCWEGASNKDGKIDNPAEFDRMWDRVVEDLKDNDKVYFEIFNEPHGYSDARWRDLAAAWIEREVKKIANNNRGRILVSGSGYNQSLTGIASDARFDGCLLSFHVYPWLAGRCKTVAGWRKEIETRIGAANFGRTIVTEWGAPMKNRPQDFYTTPPLDGNRERAYLNGVSDAIQEGNMGSIYWPGLRDSDPFSLTEREGGSFDLKITNESGKALVLRSYHR